MDASLILTNQVAAAQDVLEESEEHLDRPAVLIQKRNDLCGHMSRLVAINSVPFIARSRIAMVATACDAA